MATYNTLSWQNENSLSNFPLSSSIEFRDFLVDANFIQFDNFIPILNTISVGETAVSLAITFDYGTSTDIVLSKQSFLQKPNDSRIRIYTPAKDRYLGVISFGPGTLELFKTHKGRTIALDMAFSANTVRSIPSQDAVYTFDSLYGDVLLGRASSDDSIFYNVSTAKKSIVFHAVKHHEIANTTTKQGLRKINLVPPLYNNINLCPNPVIRINPGMSNSLEISLVAGSPNNSFQIPKV